MKNGKINDTKLLRLVDMGESQIKIANRFGVSRQAISKRLQELRGKTTKVIATKKIEKVADQRIDAIDQLTAINRRTFELLDEAEENPDLALKCVAEIRNQLRLAADLYGQMYSIQVVDEFMAIIKEILRDVDKDAYDEFKRRFNSERTLRSIVRLA